MTGVACVRDNDGVFVCDLSGDMEGAGIFGDMYSSTEMFCCDTDGEVGDCEGERFNANPLSIGSIGFTEKSVGEVPFEEP